MDSKIGVAAFNIIREGKRNDAWLPNGFAADNVSRSSLIWVLLSNRPKLYNMAKTQIPLGKSPHEYGLFPPKHIYGQVAFLLNILEDISTELLQRLVSMIMLKNIVFSKNVCYNLIIVDGAVKLPLWQRCP